MKEWADSGVNGTRGTPEISTNLRRRTEVSDRMKALSETIWRQNNTSLARNASGGSSKDVAFEERSGGNGGNDEM